MIIALPLVATPVTTPLPLTVATPGLLVDQDPPAGEPDKLSVLPEQTLPELAAMETEGSGLTCTRTEADAAQPLAEAPKVNVSSCWVVVVLINAPTSEPGVTVPPGPAGSMPIRFGLLALIQLYATPAVPPRVIVNCEPEHVIIVPGVAVKVGVVFTVTVTGVLELSHPPTVWVA